MPSASAPIYIVILKGLEIVRNSLVVVRVWLLIGAYNGMNVGLPTVSFQLAGHVDWHGVVLGPRYILLAKIRLNLILLLSAGTHRIHILKRHFKIRVALDTAPGYPAPRFDDLLRPAILRIKLIDFVL